MKKFKLFLIFLFIGLMSPTVVIGQNNNIGFDKELVAINKFSKEIPTLTFQKPDVESLLIEDETRDKNGQFYRIGVGIDVNITPQNSGLWTTLPNGDKVWRLKVNYPGAKSMSFIFSKFHLYGESTINVYNPKGKKVHLTYTKDNVLDHGQQNMSLCSGDYLMLELVEPVGSPASLIEMEKLFYAYRSSGVEANEQKINESDPCQVNVNCSPEGNNWQDEKRGVARIVMIMGNYQGLCTGSLINNTNQDCKPYFLTAMHCGEGATQSDFNNWRFYFNYEASGCSNPTSSSQVPNQYISSCQKVAGSEDVNGNTISKSDFLLVKMGTSSNESSVITTLKSWNAYWNGWDANNTASSQGVSIHHPSGDIKKISTYTTTLQSATYSGINQNTHWRVYWSATTNGHGVTEGGSSGSPIFNYNGGNSRIVGKLSGGTSYCTNTGGYDLYGKFSYSWTSAGTTNATRLKPWLDPGNTGVLVLDGSYDPCESGGGLIANFTASQTNVPEGTTVNFTDQSLGGPTSWSWTISPGSGWSYTGGTSAASQHPKVIFNTAGSYTVSLTVSNGSESDTETKNNYIVVTTGGGPTQPCVPDNGSCDEYIAQVVLNTLDNSSGCDGYIYYSNVSTTLTAGNQYMVGILPGILSEGPGYFYIDDVLGVWIDWNGNGSFTDANETIATQVLASESSPNTFNFTVPSNVQPGEYIMRVRIAYDMPNITPCVDSEYGEIEDYKIIVTGGGDPGVNAPVANFYADQTNVPVNTTVNFTNTSTNNPTSNAWTITPTSGWSYVNGTSSASINPKVNFTAAGNYTVSLTATNSGGSDTETKNNYIKVTSTSDIDVNPLNAIMVYPNPASEVIYFSGEAGINDIYRVQILDLSGKLVLDKTTQNLHQFEINIGKLAQGMYQIRLNQGSYEKVFKFVKE